MRVLRSSNSQLGLAAVLGLFGGLAVSLLELDHPWLTSFIAACTIAGGLFISLLKMILIPLIFTSLSAGIANLKAHSEMNRVCKAAIGYFLMTSALAVGIGLIAVNIFKPGMGSNGALLLQMGNQAQTSTLSIGAFLHNLLLSLFVNPISAMAHGQVLPTVVFSLFVGAALVAAGEKGKQIHGLIQEGFNLILIIVHWIMRIAPIGIFALLFNLVATQDLQILAQLALFVAVVIGTTLTHGLIVLPLLLKFFTGIGPVKFFTSMEQALLTALSTSSSSATLPVTIECVEENLKVDKSVAGFVLPLGATMNMDGSALYEAIAALFIANIVGIELNIVQQLVIFLMAIVASIGAPGIPSAGMITMVMVLEAVGLPAAGVAILLPMDRLLDTLRTAVNVEGDAVGACIVDRYVHGKRAR